MDTKQTFRQKIVQFLIKHDVLFNTLTLLLAVVAIPISLLVFPDTTMATFVIASLTGVTGAVGAVSASLMSAEDRRKAEAEEAEEDQEREEDLKWRNQHDA